MQLAFVVAPYGPVSSVIRFASMTHPATNVDVSTIAQSFFMSDEGDFSLFREICWFRVMASHFVVTSAGSGSWSPWSRYFLESNAASRDTARSVPRMHFSCCPGEQFARFALFHFLSSHILYPSDNCGFFGGDVERIGLSVTWQYIYK